MRGEPKDLPRSENASLVVSPQVVVGMVRDAHEYYIENRIDERYESMALDLIRRYVSQEGVPRELDSLFAAALYVVTRHPWSYPNPLTKTEFASKLRMKESSLEWHTDNITEKLRFATLRDKNQLPFFVDPNGTIASVIDSIVRGTVGEEVVRGIVQGSVVSSDALADKIVDRLCNVVKIVPTIFVSELHSIVRHKIEEESTRLSSELKRGQS